MQRTELDQSEFVPTSNEPTKKMCVHKLFEIVRHSLESDAADWNEEGRSAPYF